MKSIKFSENYEKLPEKWEGTEAMLMAVIPQSIPFLKNELPEFIEYDTVIRETKGHYPLNFDEGLILFFIHESGKPFTTIRRDYPSKYKYYNDSVGQWFVLAKPSLANQSMEEKK